MDDQALKPFSDMYGVDRDQYGLGPLQKNAKVFIDKANSAIKGYDVMLRIYSTEIHHVAFRLEHGNYKWAGDLEQM